MSGTEIVNDAMSIVTPSSSSYVKNESWKLISQGAEARVWKIPILLQQEQTEEEFSSSDTNNHNGQSSPPPVKRTRLEQNHVNEEEQQRQQEQQQHWMVGKERFKKSYRHVQLDERLTRQRCRMEARILEKCYNKSMDNSNSNDARNNNINTNTILRVPRVHRLDPPILFLEYLPGRTVRDALEVDLLPAMLSSLQQQQQQHQEGEQQVIETTNVVLLNLSQCMGRMIRQLHNLGIVHGDLTTSNMMLVPRKKQITTTNNNNNNTSASQLSTSVLLKDERHDADNTTTITKTTDDADEDDDDDELALIDFGLAKNTESAEERAVDLYVLERALISTHPTLPTSFIETLLDAYNSFGNNNESSSKNDDIVSENNNNSKSSAATLRRLEQVRQRGRKRECFG